MHSATANTLKNRQYYFRSKNPMADSNSADPTSDIPIVISMLELRFVLFLADFSLRVRIFAIFIHPAEVLVTDS